MTDDLSRDVPWALVTGSNRGLGLALTRTLSERGFGVVAACRNPETAALLQDFAHEVDHVRVVNADLTSSDGLTTFVRQVRQILADTGADGIDLLVNNAATGVAVGFTPEATEGPLESLDLDAIREVVTINQCVPLALTAALLPELVASGSSVVVNISSDLGSFGLAGDDKRGGVTYSTSKAGLNRVSHWLAGDAALRDGGVKVLAVHPGSVITDMGGPGAATEASIAATRIIDLALSPTAAPGVLLDASSNGSSLPW